MLKLSRTIEIQKRPGLLLGSFPQSRIFRKEQHFLLFKDQLAESEREKTNENIIPKGKFRPVENDP